MTFVASPRIRSVGCVYADRCVYAPRICAGTRWWVSLHGWVRIRAPQGAYTQVGAYTQARGAYKRVGAFTRAAGAHTQRVRIHTRVCIRRWVRLREWLGAYTQRVHICTPGCVRGTRVGASLTARAARVGRGRRVCGAQGGRTERFDLPRHSHYSGGQGLSLWCFNIVRGEILTFPDTRTHYSGVIRLWCFKSGVCGGRPPRKRKRADRAPRAGSCRYAVFPLRVYNAPPTA